LRNTALDKSKLPVLGIHWTGFCRQL